jgi:transposase
MIMTKTNDTIRAIHKEFRHSKESRYIHRLHGVLLVMSGMSRAQASKLLGVPLRTIASWVNIFDKYGLDGLHDAEISGRPSSLTDKQKQQLKAALKKSPEDFGLNGSVWTGLLVSEFLNKQCDVKFTMRHSRRILRSLERNVCESERAKKKMG